MAITCIAKCRLVSTSAALGGEVEVPYLKGVMLKIPAETQTGCMFGMRGKGVRSLRSGTEGDLLCKAWWKRQSI